MWANRWPSCGLYAWWPTTPVSDSPDSRTDQRACLPARRRRPFSPGEGTTTMFTKSRARAHTRLWRLTAYGGTVLMTAVAIAATTQAGVGGAEASVIGGQPVSNPFARIYKHPYLRDAF